MGQVLTAGQGQNPARQAAMAAGIPQEIPAWGVNQVCGSGLRSVASAVQAIMNGDANIVIAGGQESMSMSMHCQSLRLGHKMGNLEIVDTMIKDGLTDRSEEHTSELQSLMRISYAVFCLKKKKKITAVS